VPFTPKTAIRRVRELALSFPQAYEDDPWGFPVFKVADNRMFAMLASSDPVEVTMKVGAEEREIAMLLPFVRPASYVGRYGWVTVTVADEGPGIPPGLEEKLFDKFYRASPERAQSGVGLGLTICRAIVEAHGGTIRAENRSPRGAAFTFTLPRDEAPPAIESEEAPFAKAS